jgi:hypothetical protein
VTVADSVAALKLAAVGRVVERLLRHASEHDAGCPAPGECTATVELAPLAAELRGILDAEGPETRESPIDQAMAELALWSRGHAHSIPPAVLEAALLAELVSLQLDQGRTLLDFYGVCERAWHSIRRVRAAVDRVELDADGIDVEAGRILKRYADDCRARGVLRGDPTD